MSGKRLSQRALREMGIAEDQIQSRKGYNDEDVTTGLLAMSDTPSTEALTPIDRLRAMLWEAAVVGSSQGVLPASLRRRFDEALTERAIRQEAADTSGHPTHDEKHEVWDWRDHSSLPHRHRDDGSIEWHRIQEAADTSGLREAALALVRLWFDLAGPEGMSATYAALVAGHNETFSEAMWSLRAALEGASERPLDVEP